MAATRASPAGSERGAPLTGLSTVNARSRVRPAVRRFVEANPGEYQSLPVLGRVGFGELCKSDFGQMLGSGWLLEYDGTVVWEAVEKRPDRSVAGMHQEGVIPGIHQPPGDVLDTREVGDHALLGRRGIGHQRSADRHLDGVAMPMKVAAQAAVVGDAVTGVELEPAGDLHGPEYTGAPALDGP